MKDCINTGVVYTAHTYTDCKTEYILTKVYLACVYRASASLLIFSTAPRS